MKEITGLTRDSMAQVVLHKKKIDTFANEMEANAKAEFKKVKDNHNNAIIKFK
jgi:hypothetical protein